VKKNKTDPYTPPQGCRFTYVSGEIGGAFGKKHPKFHAEIWSSDVF
jgi:hypothetical protein